MSSTKKYRINYNNPSSFREALTLKIFKYPLEITDRQVIKLSGQFKPLSVQVQDGQVCLWVMVQDTPFDPDSTLKSSLNVYIVGTGNPLSIWEVNPLTNFIGTVQHNGYVWHVFTSFE